MIVTLSFVVGERFGKRKKKTKKKSKFPAKTYAN
jgi:hypothetical protein